MTDVEQAKKLFAKIVGSDFIQSNPKNNHGSATFKTTSKILFTVFPENVHEIINCVKLANNQLIPLYPVSRGMNWGYGSSVPPKDAIVLNLSRLNRILDFREDLSYVTIEPGVTFKQLFDFLKKEKLKMMIDTIGASPNASVMGNIMERGIGKGFYPKKNEHICNLEVILSNGKVIKTGFGQFGDSLVSKIFKEGLGPDLHPLFLQSNLGIVTKMTMWLSPLPDFIQIFSFWLKNENKLPTLIDKIQRLKMKGYFQESVYLSNDYKILMHKQQYPWTAMANKTPLSTTVFSGLKKKWNIQGAWYGEGLLRISDQNESSYKIKQLKENLKNIPLTIKFSDPLPGNIIYHQRYQNNIFPGVPTENTLSSMYWRKKNPQPEVINPDSDQCGVIWIGLITPFLGQITSQIIIKAKDIFANHGFEPYIGINMITERAVYIIMSIIFDREIKGEDEKALACYKDILKESQKMNIYPYRLTVNSMKYFQPLKDYRWLIKCIKKSLDVNHIIAPGRYDF